MMKRWLVLFLLVVMTVWVRLPDWWWAHHVPAEAWFTGQASWVDQIDLSLYFRTIGWGMEHATFLIPNFADSTTTNAVMLYPVYTSVGMIARLFTHNPIVTFHIVGALVGIALMLVAFWFMGIFIANTRWRLIGWYWLFLAGGIGCLLFPQPITPDIGVPIFNLWSALRSPHEAVTMISFMGFLGGSYLYFEKKRRNWLFVVGATTFGILMNHPQTIVPLGLIGGIYGLINSKAQWKQLGLWVGSVAVMALLYYGLIGKDLMTSSMSVGLRTQSTYVFSVWYWLAGWGIIGLLALYGLRQHRKHVFVALWLSIQLGLYYLPFVPYRGMMIRGIWIAIVLLAIWGAEQLAKRNRWSVVLVGVVITVLSLGDVMFIFHKRMSLSYIRNTAFVSQAEGDLVRYLQQVGKEGDGVIGSYRMANLLMGQTKLTPYAGHYPLTPNFMARYPEVVRFYQGNMTNDEAMNWLKQTQVSWVVMGTEEQRLAGAAQLPYIGLSKVWSNQAVSVYRPLFVFAIIPNSR